MRMSMIPYSIHDWSSHSANYKPENILVNRPSQQSSRWSSETNSTPQFITLKLEKPCVVYSILFGKYEKTHVCNLKKFKVYGGLEEDHLIELLEGGLKNDNNPEKFSLKYHIENQSFPCQFIKIVPLMSWGATFNFSIWHVELHGVSDEQVVQPCLQWYYKYRETQVLRLCMKHFRQCNYMEAFDTLQKQTNVKLEDPFLTQLHKILVQDGDFQNCERLIEAAAAGMIDNLFTPFISKQQYKPVWSQIIVKNVREKAGWPAKRGGHQMCADHLNGCLYLFGGWNGVEDLADFWRFSCKDAEWTLLSSNTENEGGPSARSCHKMCMDCQNQKIYTLGRYLDSTKRSQEAIANYFYVYNVTSKEWHLIAKDVALLGGPRLVFDHQMCFDEKSQKIFVFGGRILTSSSKTNSSIDERPIPEFGGLYSYSVIRNEWKLLREDSGNAGPQDIRSRIGHSMLLDTKRRCLFIFGGQRSKECVNDFLCYNIDQDCIAILNDGSQQDSGFPPSGFTQRATIDADLGEIYMQSGLSKDRDKRDENMHNSFWVYTIDTGRWQCVYSNESQSLPRFFGDAANNFSWLSTRKVANASKTEPHPRYAHQLAFDRTAKVHYMFGGNPGNSDVPTLRLDDLWCLSLVRPSQDDLLRQCRFQIRKQRFIEMVSSDRISALAYLQLEVAQVVDHSAPEEASEFQSLAVKLFGDLTLRYNYSLFQQTDNAFTHQSRTALFEKLLEYFPVEMTQPRGNLVDLVSFTA